MASGGVNFPSAAKWDDESPSGFAKLTAIIPAVKPKKKAAIFTNDQEVAGGTLKVKFSDNGLSFLIRLLKSNDMNSIGAQWTLPEEINVSKSKYKVESGKVTFLLKKVEEKPWVGHMCGAGIEMQDLPDKF